MRGRKYDRSAVEKPTAKNKPIGYKSTSETKLISKPTTLEITPGVVALHLWKEALEIVEADRCFGIHSRPEDVYKDLLDLETI